MKNLIVLLALSLMFSNCQTIEQSSTDQNFDLTEVPKYKFKLVGEVEGTSKLVTQIEVFKKENNAPHQTLKDFEADVQVNEDVILEDLNFDGYPDIRLMQFLPGSANIPYFYWLYNPDKNVFERNQDMEVIQSPALDKQQQVLISQWRENMSIYGSDFYKFIASNQLQLLRQERFEIQEDNSTKRIVKKMIDGELTVVKEEIVTGS